jgi:hypothetical protein
LLPRLLNPKNKNPPSLAGHSLALVRQVNYCPNLDQRTRIHMMKPRVRTTLKVSVVVALGAGLAWFEWLRPAMRLADVDSAIVTLRILAGAEKRFAESHPQEGYACRFSRLDLSELPKEFGESSRRSGYAFEISCPGAEDHHTDFQVTARPLEKDMAAYCVDQSGILKYDEGGSVSRCLAAGTGL